MRTLLFIMIFFNVQNLSAQEHGWQANPELVEQLEKDRPANLWRESEVRSFQLPRILTDGINNPEEWKHRRSEILNQFRTYMYGHRPGPPEQLTFEVTEEDPEAMGGNATLYRITIQSNHEDRSHQFEVILFLPNKRQKPVPVFLLINNRDAENTDPTRQNKSGFWPAEEVIERGYGLAAIQNGDLAPDDEDQYYKSIIRLFEGEAAAEDRNRDDWMALAAWGWGASRVMDYFETNPGVDNSKVAVIGHSRGGKASLWAGAEDERFALVISNNSGSGGAALSRRKFGETVRDVNRFGHWFASNFEDFNDREEELPIDQHMLISLIAPRAVYVASADRDLWADPRGEFLSLAFANPVFALWNQPPINALEMPSPGQQLIAGTRGYHIRSGEHNLTPGDWSRYMDFADRLWR
ncbi:MAG: hypothetical protein WEA56_08500 [Balneolaceae bacterium]